MSGKDTHVRGLRVLGPVEYVLLSFPVYGNTDRSSRDNATDDDPFPFVTPHFKIYETIR